MQLRRGGAGNGEARRHRSQRAKACTRRYRTRRPAVRCRIADNGTEKYGIRNTRTSERAAAKRGRLLLVEHGEVEDDESRGDGLSQVRPDERLERVVRRIAREVERTTLRTCQT